MNEPVTHHEFEVLVLVGLLVMFGLPKILDAFVGPLYDSIRDYYDEAKFAEWARYKAAQRPPGVGGSCRYSKGYNSGFRAVPDDRLPPGTAAAVEVVHVPEGYHPTWPGYEQYTGYERGPRHWYESE